MKTTITKPTQRQHRQIGFQTLSMRIREECANLFRESTVMTENGRRRRRPAAALRPTS
jgi:hypothetical protein